MESLHEVNFRKIQHYENLKLLEFFLDLRKFQEDVSYGV